MNNQNANPKINKESIKKAEKHFIKLKDPSKSYNMSHLTQMVRSYLVDHIKDNNISIVDVFRNDKSIETFLQNIYVMYWIFTILVTCKGEILQIMNIGKFSARMTKSKTIKHVKTQETTKSKPKKILSLNRASFVKNLDDISIK